MSERERWIVYPLLFFALGAALRDKFTQQVTTDRLRAGQITCEELLVTDSEKPDRVVAKLTSNETGNPSGDRYGVFVLIDSEGKELCGVTNNQLHVNQIACKSVFSNAIAVLDPRNPAQPLAMLSSAETIGPDQTVRRIGRLVLTDSQGKEHFGLADDQLRMRQIICEGIAITDPGDPGRTLAALGSIAVPSATGGEPQRFGVLALNNQQFGSLLGLPPRKPIETPSEGKGQSEQARPENGNNGAASRQREVPEATP